MSTKLLFAALVALVAVQIQNVSCLEERALSLPIINPFDLKGTMDSLANFTKGLFSGVSEVAQNAVKAGLDAENTVKGLAQKVINDTTNQIKTLAEKAVNQIKNGPLGNAVRAVECSGPNIGAIFSASGTTIKNVTSCVTNEVNAVLGPAEDLISAGGKAAALVPGLYNNVTSCFPNGFSADLGGLMCAFGKIGPAATEVSGIVTSLTKDIGNIQSAVANFRTSMVRCPRERIADFVINIGNIVANYGKCVTGSTAANTTSVANTTTTTS